MKDMNLLRWRNFDDNKTFNNFKKSLKVSLFMVLVVGCSMFFLLKFYNFYLENKLQTLEFERNEYLLHKNALVELGRKNKDAIQKILFIDENLTHTEDLFAILEFLSQPHSGISLTKFSCNLQTCTINGNANAQSDVKKFLSFLKSKNLSDSRIIDFIGASTKNEIIDFAVEFSMPTQGSIQVDYAD